MLQLEHISMTADNNKEILDDVSFQVDDGKFVVITGPNGGGKSTLAKVIAGIRTASGGRILLDGADITNASVTERAKRGIGFAFQQPVRFKGLTVRDLLTLAANTEISEKQLHLYLREVGLCPRDYIDREVNASLSGGEIKRIEIAMVMARMTKLTIFDEPEAGIDLWSFNNLINVFQKLRREIQGSVLIISHQERILDIADEIIVLSAGKIVAQGKKADILPELLGEKGRCMFCAQEEENCCE